MIGSRPVLRCLRPAARRSRTPAARLLRSVITSAGAGLLLVVTVPTICLALWSASTTPGSAAEATGLTMRPGIQPTLVIVTAAGSDVSVSWTASESKPTVAGFEVLSANATTGVPRVVGAGCSGIVAETSCVETGVPDGSWRYSIVPRLENWAGAASAWSTPVTVDTSYRALVMSDSPAAYWRLGESSGTTAVDQMAVANGTYGGGVALGAAGALVSDADTAAGFDGLSGRVSAPAVAALDPTTALTIEAWINPDTTRGTTWIVNKGIMYYLYVVDGTINFGAFTDNWKAVITPLVSTGSWQHFVGTYDGTTFVLYRDGVVVGQTLSAGPILASTTPLFIGAYDATTQYFDGSIDEVAVYTRALSAAQVLAHFQRGNRDRPDLVTSFPNGGHTYRDATWGAGCTSTICGTATNTGGGVAAVSVSVRSGTGNYWNGTAFASSTEVMLAATGTATWNLPFPAGNFPSDGSYTVRAMATSPSGTIASSSNTFVFDRTSPVPSGYFPVAGTIYSAASWDAGCFTAICISATDATSGVTSFAISVRQGTGNYWNGTAFASATEVLMPATLSSLWYIVLPAAKLPADGAYTVRGVATDRAGNTGAVSIGFTFDRTAPSMAFTFPAAGGSYGTSSWDAGCSTAGVGDLCGTASDATSGVASTTVSIRQGVGNYWNGTSFASATEVLLATTGTTSWSRAMSAASFSAGGDYTVRAVTTDTVGNTNTVSRTFTMDATAPTPTGVVMTNASGLLNATIDEVAVTFSEAPSVGTLCSTWTGTGDQALGGTGLVVTITNNGTSDILTVTSTACTLRAGSINTGRDYVTATATFGGTAPSDSRVTWTAATRQLRVHLGALTSGTSNTVAQTAGTVVYTANAAVTDVAGNPISTTPLSVIGQRF